MARMLERHHSISGTGAGDDAQKSQREETRSDRLAAAESTEERQAVLEDYVVNHSEEFGEDCKAVARLLEENDREGLVAHGRERAAERARAKAAAIRAGR